MAPLPEGPQLALDFPHEPSHAEEDFIVGEGNRLAYDHIVAWPAWPGPLSLLVGAPASGKSHLARIFADRSGALSAGPEQIEELSRHGGVAPVVIEDVDRLAFGEAELFHILNQSMRDRRPVLMTAREPVGNWPYRTDDLLSRARLASTFLLKTTDDIQLSHILVKLLGDRQVTVEPRVVAYLAARMERSAEEVEALADLMDRLALSRGTGITRSIATEALAIRRAGRDDGQFELDLERADERDD